MKNKFRLKVGKLYRFYSLCYGALGDWESKDWESETCSLPVYRSKSSTNHINLKEPNETFAGTTVLILGMDEECCQVLTESGEIGWFSWKRFDTCEHEFQEIVSEKE